MASYEKANISKSKREYIQSILSIIESAYYRAKTSKELTFEDNTITFEVILLDMHDTKLSLKDLFNTLFDLSNKEPELIFSEFRSEDDISMEVESYDNPHDTDMAMICHITTPKDFLTYHQKLWRKYDNPNTVEPKTEDQDEQKDQKQIIIYLNDHGDLWRNPKEEHCYPMNADDTPIKLFKYLNEEKNKAEDLQDESKYIETIIIAQSLNITADQVRRVIGKINTKAEDRLDINPKQLKEDKLIMSKRNSGYKLNPKYRITPLN